MTSFPLAKTPADRLRRKVGQNLNSDDAKSQRAAQREPTSASFPRTRECRPSFGGSLTGFVIGPVGQWADYKSILQNQQPELRPALPLLGPGDGVKNPIEHLPPAGTADLEEHLANRQAAFPEGVPLLVRQWGGDVDVRIVV